MSKDLKDTKQAQSSKPETGLTRPETMTQADLVRFGEFDESKMLATGELEDAFMSLDKFIEQAKKSGLTLRKIAKLEAGQSVKGVFLGRGPDIMLQPNPLKDRPNPKTGEYEPKLLKTWAVQVSPRVIGDFMGSHQLDREFERTEIGSPIMFALIKQVETRAGNRVNDYHFLRPGMSIEEVIAKARAEQSKVIEGTVESRPAESTPPVGTSTPQHSA